MKMYLTLPPCAFASSAGTPGTRRRARGATWASADQGAEAILERGREAISTSQYKAQAKGLYDKPTFDIRCDTSRARTRERTRPDPSALRKKGLRRASKSAMRSFETVCNLMSKSSSGASSISTCLAATTKSKCSSLLSRSGPPGEGGLEVTGS